MSVHGEAFAAWWAAQDDPDELSARTFEDHFVGDYGSLADWGQDMLDDLGFNPQDLPGVPEHIAPYVSVNVEAWTRDMELSGEIRTAESKAGVYVFWTG